MKKLLTTFLVLLLVAVPLASKAFITPVFSPGGFAPNNIASLIAWYDASDTSTIADTGGAVDQWDDKSSSGYDLTATSTQRPTTDSRTVNGNNVLDFDGTDDFMTVPTGLKSALSISSNQTLFMVVVDDDITVIGTIITAVNTGSDVMVSVSYSSQQTTGWYNGSSYSMESGSVTQDVAQVFTVEHSASTKPELRIDGVDQAGSLTPGANLSGGARVGTDTGGARQWNGAIAELIVYNTILTTAQKVKVENYLSNKWGI